MGTAASALTIPVRPNVSDPVFPLLARTLAPGSAVAAAKMDSLTTNDKEGAVNDAYESAVYQSRYEKVAFSLSLQETVGLFQQQEGDTAEALLLGERQLEFSFFQETRTEELALFSERTSAVGKSLADVGSTQTTRFAQVAQSISEQFQMSAKVSGAALSGFASAAEQTQTDDDLMSNLLDITDQVYNKAQEIFDQVFELLGGFFSGVQSQDDFASRIQDLFNEMFSKFFGSAEGQSAQNTLQAAGVQLEFSFSMEVSMEVSVTQGEVQQGDPLVLDLDGDGIELTSYTQGAKFDLMGTGKSVQTAFVTGGDAFLAMDLNKDGIINSGLELFGEQRGAANGFEELRKLDSNRDGYISSADEAFGSLLLFRDNGDGVSAADELVSLAEAGVQEINLNYRQANARASGGNTLAQLASFRRTDGSFGKVGDALLNFIA